MATSKIDCGVCNLRKLSRPPDVWCPECDEGLCTDCKEHHSMSKSSRDHKTISIAEYLNQPYGGWKISQFCDKHDEKYQTFCKKHDTPCCRRCVIESHNECKDLAALEDIVKNIKTSAALDEAETKLMEIVENIQILVENKKRNIETLQEQRKNIEAKIRQTRQRINDHLDTIQKAILKDLHTVEETEKNHILSLVSSFEQSKRELNNLQCTLESAKQNATNIQIFLAIKKIETSVAAKDKFLYSFAKDDRVENKLLSCKIDATLQSFKEKIKMFGEIIIGGSKSNVNLIKLKDQQAQIVLHDLPIKSTFNNVTLNKIRRVNTESQDVTGCLMFPDGRMMFSCDTEKRMLACNADGTKDFEIIIPNSRAFDFTKVENIVAVTSAMDKKISFVDIVTRRVIDTIQVRIYNFGITSINKEIIYCAKDKGIQMLNINNKRSSDIANILLERYSYVTTFREKLLVTVPSRRKVLCYTLNGNVEWEFTGESSLRSLKGISSDNDGNVYVVDNEASNIVVISPDGQHCRKLSCEANDLTNPWAIHFEKSRNEILVANRDGTILVYSVSL